MIRAVVLLGGPSKKASYGCYEQASPLFPICGLEVIGHLFQNIQKQKNIKDFVLLGYYDKNCFTHFQDQQQKLYGKQVRYLKEDGECGTGGGLAQNLDLLFADVEDVLIVHSDICTDLHIQKFYQFHKNKNAVCSIMTVLVSKEDSIKYGCLIKDSKTDQLIHHAEKPEQYISDLVNCGVYLLNQTFKNAIEQAKREKAESLNTELKHFPYLKYIKKSSDLNINYLSLENNILKQAEKGTIYLYQHTGFWQSIKTPNDLLKANKLLLQYYSQYPFNFNNQDYELKENQVLIHKSAKVHHSAVLGSNVVIGAGCEIGEGVRIKDSIILDGVEIKNYSLIQNSIICYNSIIGYWCRIEGDISFLGPCVIVDNEIYLRNVVCLQNSRVLNNQEGGCLM